MPVNFVHITDTHILDKPETIFHGLNTKESFESVLSASLERYPGIDFVLLTGDISQTGTRDSYALFQSSINGVDPPVYCIPGNHDTPGLLQEVIPSCPNDSVSVIDLGPFSLILLNSRVQNEEYGLLSSRCLEQLRDHLSNNQDQFNIIAVHHPPMSIHSEWLDKIGLRNKKQFLALLSQCSWRTLLLFGHVHQEVDQQIDGLRLLSTPSTCYQFHPKEKEMRRVYSPPCYRFVRVEATGKVETRVHPLTCSHARVVV